MTILKHPARVAWPRTKRQVLHWLRDGLIDEADLATMGIGLPEIRAWERAEAIAERKGWDLPSQELEAVEG
jgi:hypothetical protein